MKIGIDIGGSHIEIGLIDDKGIIIDKEERYIINSSEKNTQLEIKQENLKQELEEFIINKINQYKQTIKIESIGIAVPGTVDKTTIIRAVNLKLENYNISKIIEEKTNIKVHLRNDAKCSALAELRYGNLKGYENGMFLCIGTGIGGAIVYNGKVLEAKNVPGYEFSHMIIQKNGIKCNCGKRGCFEAYSSIKRFKEKIAKEFCLDNLNNNYIKDFIINNLNDVRLRYFISQYIENLAIGISNLINIFEPEIIVFGGGFVDYSDILLEPLKQQILTTNLLFNKRDDIILKLAKLGNDAGIIGASLNDKTPIFNE